MNAVEQSGFDQPSLAERLRERIIEAGPITFHDWMAAALYDPQAGYYCCDRARWGREGDYRTSPERSVLFAATFARYFAKLYGELGRPERWTIVEAGAGSGQFAEVVLERLQRRFPEVFAATRYVVAEVSANSCDRARERLTRFGDQVEFRDLASIATIETGIIFSNELLDAFPAHRVTVNNGQLCEYYVNVAVTGEFEWSLGPVSTPRLAEYLALNSIELADGQVGEINLGAADWLALVAAKLNRGYFITVDYGAETSALNERRQGTLRAFSRHQIAEDILAHPGEQDITATVNWSDVKRAGETLQLRTVAFDRQDRFLLDAGLLEELELMAAETRSTAEQLRLRTSAREMILPGGMATSFDVLVQKQTR
jgi:SAM-dependent MidA family methyltransferase